MQHKVFYFISVSGKKLFGQAWSPEGEVKASIILVHGFGEHSSRYESYVQLFVDRGISVVTYDQIGHGQSEGKHGAVQSYKQLLDDVELIIRKADDMFPDVPKFIYGHSMGGNIALNYLLSRNYPLVGGIISSPWLVLANDPNAIKKTTASVLKRFFPNLTVKSGLETEFISTQAKVVKAYREDPLTHGRISFRLFSVITRQGLWAIANTWRLKKPVLMVHGTDDKITSPLASSLAAKENKKFIDYVEWPKMYHELHNEPIRNELADSIINWLLNKCSTAEPPKLKAQ